MKSKVLAVLIFINPITSIAQECSFDEDIQIVSDGTVVAAKNTNLTTDEPKQWIEITAPKGFRLLGAQTKIFIGSNAVENRTSKTPDFIFNTEAKTATEREWIVGAKVEAICKTGPAPGDNCRAGVTLSSIAIKSSCFTEGATFKLN